MAPPRSSNKENSPPTKRPRKTLLSAAASRARNAPLTGALSESPSQLPALHAPPTGHQTARARSTTKAKQPPAFTAFTNETGATERIVDDADPTPSIINERTVFSIVDRCSLTDDDLFSELTADDIRVLVERLLPDLQEEGVQEFLATIYDHACTSPPFLIPRRERHPSTWPLTYPDMDLAWGQAVEGEHAIELPETMESWIDMSESNLVKPTGSLRDTLLIVSSYPTARVGSTVHQSYGTTMDMSNVSMFMLYAKLGHHVSSIRHHGALHLNLYPRRINRKLVPTGQGVLAKLPAQLREYWTSFAHELIDSSHSKVALLVGSAGIATYVAYLKANKIESKEMWVSGSNDHVHHKEHPSAWLEYDVNGNIRRIAFGVPHPEFYNRFRGTVVTHKVRANAIKERLVDYVKVLLWNDADLQTFLSTTTYRFMTTIGVVIRMSHLEGYAEENQNLKDILSIPILSNDALHVLLKKNSKVSTEEARDIKAWRKRMNVQVTDDPTHWEKPEVVERYGNHALTFQMIAERRELPTQSDKPQQQPLSLSLYTIEGNPFLDRYNAEVSAILNKDKDKGNQTTRKKRKQAIKMTEEEQDMVQEEEKTEEER